MSEQKKRYISVCFLCILGNLILIIYQRFAFSRPDITQVRIACRRLPVTQMIISDYQNSILIQPERKVLKTFDILDHPMRNLQNRTDLPLRLPDFHMQLVLLIGRGDRKLCHDNLPPIAH